MRTVIKKVLASLGLIEKVRLVYNSAKSLSFSTLKEEMKYKKSNLPDGYPAPPKELVFLIIGLRWVSVYYNSGKKIFEEMKELFLANNIDINSFENILDFGCGCGRVIRHFNSNTNNPKLYGSDYNEVLVNWCANNLSFGKFSANKLAPPLKYEDGFFDLIYARSVFTHLSPGLQKAWMEEYERILKRGGYLYFSTHGDNTFHNLNPKEQAILQKEGIIAVNVTIQGDNRCATYQTKDFVEKQLTKGFEIVNFTPGQNNSSSPQDIYILKKS